jgi:hypothetical protein
MALGACPGCGVAPGAVLTGLYLWRRNVVFVIITHFLLDLPLVLVALGVLARREPPHGPVVQTGHGFHWYVKPTGVGNRAGVLPGVDFRGRGSYVLGPPSVHPNGHRYRWINPLREQLARVPDWLMHLLVPERGPERPRTVPEGSRAYGLGALRRELQRLSQAREGTRNHQLNIAAFNMGRLVAAGAICEEEAAAALIEQGQRIGLEATECERTVASGLSAGMEQPRGIEIG